LSAIKITGVSPRAPLTVAFVAPKKAPLDLYDIAKGLENRLRQYGKLKNKYSRLEGSKLKDGLAVLDELDRKLALFDADLTSEFESAVELQKKITAKKPHLTSIEEDLAAARIRQREIKEAPAPPIYVNVDRRKWSSRDKQGFKPLNDALQRAEAVERSLYQTLLDNYNTTTQELYDKNRSKLDWLNKTEKKYKNRTDQKRKEDLETISRTIAGLEQEEAANREEFKAINREKAELMSRLRVYYRQLTSNIDDSKPAPDLDNLKTGSQAVDAIYEAMDWINNQYGYLSGERSRIDQELGKHIEQLMALDRQLAVLARDFAEHRQQASCWVIRALKKKDNGDLIEVMTDFNNLAVGLNDSITKASDRADKLDYGSKIFSEYRTDLFEKFGKKIEILSKSAERVKSWSGPVEKLLVMNKQFENEDPMFFVSVLEGAGDIAEKVPVIGSTIKMFLDYNAFLSKRILEQAQLVHSHLALQAVDMLQASDGSQRSLPPKIHLYSAKDIKATIETRLFSASDAEVQEIATEFQILRIKHLLAKGL